MPPAAPQVVQPISGAGEEAPPSYAVGYSIQELYDDRTQHMALADKEWFLSKIAGAPPSLMPQLQNFALQVPEPQHLQAHNAQRPQHMAQAGPTKDFPPMYAHPEARHSESHAQTVHLALPRTRIVSTPPRL